MTQEELLTFYNGLIDAGHINPTFTTFEQFEAVYNEVLPPGTPPKDKNRGEE